MSSWLEKKYLNLISSSLRNFKRKSDNLYNWSCTFCGDSQKNSRKARSYAYMAGNKFLVTCHNCGITTNVPKLLKHVAPSLYEDYVKELMMEKYRPIEKEELFAKQNKKSISALRFKENITDVIKVSELSTNHPCKRYVEKRMIPKEWYDRLWFSSTFMTWTNTMLPGKFSENALKHDEPRLVIPFIAKDNKVFGYQGRSLNPDAEVRYISIILDETYPKIFGLDRVDVNRKFYTVEGPLDSMFIPNSVAAAGGELLQVVSQLNKENAILVFDNEPRSKETCKKIQKAITLGYKVCIWPSSIEEKDINELVMNNMTPSFIKQLMGDRLYEGMEAQLVFDSWKKR